MSRTPRAYQKYIPAITFVTVVFIACVGALFVIAPARPFWIDEWFTIYNLKTKSAAELMGPLDLMQQFPRVYLVLLKWFVSFFDYSYVSLRLPSYVISLLTIVLSYRVMNKIFGKQIVARHLFVLILISSYTFTEYFVQAKQYSMDIFLSVFAVWQLVALQEIKPGHATSPGRYAFLCISFLIVPFLSYPYTIAIAPVFVVAMFRCISLLNAKEHLPAKWKTIGLQCFPLLICAASIALFYEIDIKQLSQDKNMYRFWEFLLPDANNKLHSTLTAFYKVFSQLGSGDIFGNLFGILGIAAFISGIIFCIKAYTRKQHDLSFDLATYSCLLLLLAFTLFLFKKLPLGTPRLNAFTVPSLSILLIFFIDRVSAKFRTPLQAIILPSILCIGAAGNVFSTFAVYFTSPKYKKQLQIYAATEDAIKLAQARKIPILVTPDITYPYAFEVGATSDATPNPAVWVLKTFPAYDMAMLPPVYFAKDMAQAQHVTDTLPASISAVVAGDGIKFLVVEKSGTPR